MIFVSKRNLFKIEEATDLFEPFEPTKRELELVTKAPAKFKSLYQIVQTHCQTKNIDFSIPDFPFEKDYLATQFFSTQFLDFDGIIDAKKLKFHSKYFLISFSFIFLLFLT